MLVKTYITLLLCILCSFRINAQQIKRDDTEKLERAIGYFQGGKYHEALLLLEDLNKNMPLIQDSRRTWVSVIIMNGTTRMHVKFLKAQYLNLRFWLHANSQYIITVWQRAASCRMNIIKLYLIMKKRQYYA